MFFSRIYLIMAIALFLSIIVNILYVLLSIVLVLLCYSGLFAQPVLIFLIPFLLLTCMFNLIYACDYDNNVEFFLNLFKKNSFNYLLYASAYLLNPLLLFVYSRSYNNCIRVWGILRCFPIINIILYRKLIKDIRNADTVISNKRLILLYLKGKLLLSIVNKNL